VKGGISRPKIKTEGYSSDVDFFKFEMEKQPKTRNE
jgi:hypothetical protein